MYGGVRGRKTRVGEKLHRFPPTRFAERMGTESPGDLGFPVETGFPEGAYGKEEPGFSGFPGETESPDGAPDRGGFSGWAELSDGDLGQYYRMGL